MITSHHDNGREIIIKLISSGKPEDIFKLCEPGIEDRYLSLIYDIVWGRYLAMVISLSVLILAMATYYNIKVIKHFGIENIDLLAYYKYTIIWLIPTMMISLAVGTLITIATDSPIGIIVQLVWFFVDISSKFESMQGGGYGMSLVLRHNTVGNPSAYMNNISQILINRFIYVTIALVMLALAERVYNYKRVGKLGGLDDFRKAR